MEYFNLIKNSANLLHHQGAFSPDETLQNVYLNGNGVAFNTLLCHAGTSFKYGGVYVHVAADSRLQETYFKACCTPFRGNVSFKL